jgi:hypothetical protein
MTDKEVKNALAARWQAAATALGEPVRIVKRWKLSIKGQEPMQALRSLTADKLVNGLFITRTRRASKKLGSNHWEYKWTYSMVYFRSYEEGTDAANSEDKLNALLERVAEEFENEGDLGLAFVDDHEELQVDNIDTIDLRVHAATCSIVVNLTKQG